LSLSLKGAQVADLAPLSGRKRPERIFVESEERKAVLAKSWSRGAAGIMAL
jgi:hypothetical protein